MKRAVLYIIHGWTYNVEPWVAVVEELGRLGVSAELLKVPGLGEASRKVWTVEEYVEWADGLIPAGAVALGHSNGGRILLNMLASEGSERLSGLILLGSAGVYERSVRRSVKKGVAKIFSPLKRFGLLRKVFHRLVGAGDYARAPENMKKTLANMLASDRRLDVSGVTTPTRLIWGEEDRTTPLRMGRKLAGELRDAKLVVKAGWGHAPYLKYPKKLAAEIVRQLKELK